MESDGVEVDPAVHLKVDGEAAPPLHRDANTYHFRFSAGAGDVRLCSLTGASPHCEDRRTLGVSIRRITLSTPTVSIIVNHDSPLLTEGFYVAEPTRRWTSGEARIPFELLGALDAGVVSAVIELGDVLPAYGRPPPAPSAGESVRDERPSSKAKFKIDLVQHIRAACSDHYEGVAFSSSGHLLAVAAAEAGEIHVFKRGLFGKYGQTPALRLRGCSGGMVFPHDAAFVDLAGVESLVGLERRGVLTVWRVERGRPLIADTPVARVDLAPAAGPHLDSIAFLPGGAGRFAVADYQSGTISFFKLDEDESGHLDARQEGALTSTHLKHPDGIALSDCGRWLAVANHGDDSVAVFRRSHRPGAAPVFDPRPVSLIKSAVLRHPHSVGFARRSKHLWVSSSGCSDVHVFEGRGPPDQRLWPGEPIQALSFCPADIFEPANRIASGEGGAKGLGLRGDRLCVASPEMGVKLFRIRR